MLLSNETVFCSVFILKIIFVLLFYQQLLVETKHQEPLQMKFHMSLIILLSLN